MFIFLIFNSAYLVANGTECEQRVTSSPSMKIVKKSNEVAYQLKHNKKEKISNFQFNCFTFVIEPMSIVSSYTNDNYSVLHVQEHVKLENANQVYSAVPRSEARSNVYKLLDGKDVHECLSECPRYDDRSKVLSLLCPHTHQEKGELSTRCKRCNPRTSLFKSNRTSRSSY